jgi:multidrug efflux pump subunit AcrB
MTFQAESGPSGYRPDVTVSLSANDTEVLAAASEVLVEKAREFGMTRDVNDDFTKGKSQLDFEMLPEGRALGLTAAGVGQQVRDAFYGALALRYLRRTNEVEVRVKLPKEERKELYNLEDLVIQTPDGTEVALLEVVSVKSGDAFTRILRRDGRRVVNVTMDVEPKRATSQVLEALDKEVLPELRADYPGLTWSFEGSNADMRESTAALWSGFGISMALIYALLAVAFGSYLQPLIVLSAIPFGLVGAVAGHILLGFDLSLISLMGVIALSGVVVNDSIIMIDYANKRRAEKSVFAAIHEAGLRRFRPILLTTLTTFGGLTPIILEQSLQAQYLIPMAISLGFGIVFATAIILVLVPCLYLSFEEMKIRLGKS